MSDHRVSPIMAFVLAAMLCGLFSSPSSARADGENAAQRLTRSATAPEHNLSEDRVLYCVGYAHLDTQWRWDFPITIDRYIRDTLVHNFERFEAFPDYTFSFTGSVRYEMMKEYYPQLYVRLKKYIAQGRWFVSGSSVDEGDALVPSAESIIRQVLYGNLFFRREFDRESVDFMLPDCFGFPASMPTIWSHCGLLGFSTQKLTWGSAVGIPFKIGVWEGPDGSSVLAALDPGAYVGAIKGRVDRNTQWAERIDANGRRFGVFADYHYYGVGDMGGAPREEDVRNYVGSMGNKDGLFMVKLASSDQFFKDITPRQRQQLPRYRGDMLLTEHSAGTLTSQCFMKRCNRKGERLADAAERAAVAAYWIGAAEYPRKTLEQAWVRLLANQMHDILPGTSIPKAYTWSWNDEFVAMNLFASVLTDSIESWSSILDITAQGMPLIVYNPLEFTRKELVEARVAIPGRGPVRVFGPDNKEVPSQVLERRDGMVRLLFSASVPAVGLSIYDIRRSASAYTESKSPLHVDEKGLENARYRVRLNARGDVSDIFDKQLGRELLRQPHRLVFTHESPKQYPAWNMDWEDRREPPLGYVDGEPRVRIVEKGPLRVSLKVERHARNSVVDQKIILEHGGHDGILRFDTKIDWQSAGVALKASFPLKASNPTATYSWGTGTIERGNNDSKKYEVPSHQWFDLTDHSGEFGVSILEDCKYASDKPSDEELRLTLLYSPEVSSTYQDQHSQDWGIHRMSYALAGHPGDWRDGASPVHAKRFNNPMLTFSTSKHKGAAGRVSSLLSIKEPGVGISAIKLAETKDTVIVRLQEQLGRKHESVRLRFGSGVSSAKEVDGQEREIGEVETQKGDTDTNLSAHALRAIAMRPVQAPYGALRRKATSVALPFDTDVISMDGNRSDGAMDNAGRTIPAEVWPTVVSAGDVHFKLGPTDDGQVNAVSCRGQSVKLPDVPGNRLILLAAASGERDVDATFGVGDLSQELMIQSWTGFVGQWDVRIWHEEPPEIFHSWEGRVTGFSPAYAKRAPIAWFATHRHHPQLGNEAYRFCYVFKYALERPTGAETLTLPDEPRIKIFSAAIVDEPFPGVRPTMPLYDEFEKDRHVSLRHQYPSRMHPVYEAVKPTGRVIVERAAGVEALVLATPSRQDFGDASLPRDIAFRALSPNGKYQPHQGAGLKGDRLPRLNDGLVARNSDDTDRCVWYDQEGRFFVDLGRDVALQRVNTFSWHKSNRAPQHFSLWGAGGDEMPDAEFEAGKHGEWTLLGVVNSSHLGDGGVHVSSVVGESGDLGKHRYLLWVAEDMGQGTFFMEIDVHAAE